jgi:hypothetical protein
MKVLALDISGNWKEGKGTTGIAIWDDTLISLHEIKAAHYDTPEGYWQAHVDFIQTEFPDELVFEGYRLYNHKGAKADMQANSILETPQLSGIIRLTCYQFDIPCTIQFASDVKKRWHEDILVHLGYLEKQGKSYYYDTQLTNTHKRDALKHLLHYMKYRRKVEQAK